MTNLFAENEEFIKQFVPDEFKDPVLVDITNVHHYRVNKDEGRHDIRDFELKLPWSYTWFEYQCGKYIWGVFAIYNKEDDRNYYYTFNSPRRSLQKKLGGIQYMGVAHHKTSRAGLELEGGTKGDISPSYMKAVKQGIFSKKDVLDAILSTTATVYFATTFCNCKNMEYYEKSYPKKLQKANIKRGKTPQETYKMLDIGGPFKQSKSEEGENRNETGRALHICRGHFKIYTEENPLFGKHTGRFWCPDHTRGDTKNGKVNKDYRVSANA